MILPFLFWRAPFCFSLHAQAYLLFYPLPSPPSFSSLQQLLIRYECQNVNLVKLQDYFLVQISHLVKFLTSTFKLLSQLCDLLYYLEKLKSRKKPQNINWFTFANWRTSSTTYREHLKKLQPISCPSFLGFVNG